MNTSTIGGLKKMCLKNVFLQERDLIQRPCTHSVKFQKKDLKNSLTARIESSIDQQYTYIRFLFSTVQILCDKEEYEDVLFSDLNLQYNVLM